MGSTKFRLIQNIGSAVILAGFMCAAIPLLTGEGHVTLSGYLVTFIGAFIVSIIFGFIGPRICAPLSAQWDAPNTIAFRIACNFYMSILGTAFLCIVMSAIVNGIDTVDGINYLDRTLSLYLAILPTAVGVVYFSDAICTLLAKALMKENPSE